LVGIGCLPDRDGMGGIAVEGGGNPVEIDPVGDGQGEFSHQFPGVGSNHRCTKDAGRAPADVNPDESFRFTIENGTIDMLEFLGEGLQFKTLFFACSGVRPA